MEGRSGYRSLTARCCTWKQAAMWHSCRGSKPARAAGDRRWHWECRMTRKREGNTPDCIEPLRRPTSSMVGSVLMDGVVLSRPPTRGAGDLFRKNQRQGWLRCRKLKVLVLALIVVCGDV